VVAKIITNIAISIAMTIAAINKIIRILEGGFSFCGFFTFSTGRDSVLTDGSGIFIQDMSLPQFSQFSFCASFLVPQYGQNLCGNFLTP